MKVYELLKELPHDKFMPLLLGACETGSEVSVIQEWCLIQ